MGTQLCGEVLGAISWHLFGAAFPSGLHTVLQALLHSTSQLHVATIPNYLALQYSRCGRLTPEEAGTN